MQDFLVTLYAAHLPGAGVLCRAQFLGETLLLEGEQPQRVAAGALRVEKGGFDDDSLFLNWELEGAAYSATPVDKSAQRVLLASAPASLAPQLKRWGGQVGAQHFKWNAVIGALAVAIIAAALLFWRSEDVAAWLAGKVSPERELRLGQAALAQIKSEGGLTQEGAAADTVKTVGARLTRGSRYSYQWYVKQDKDVNAFALPGGIVVVHSALIAKSDSAEELAGVLAHEVQHIELRHSLQQMIHSAGWAALLAVTLGDVSAITAIIIHQAGNLRHSRQLEAQADAEGVKALLRTGISPAGMAAFFKRMAKEKPDSIALLSTHPAPAERLEAIETLARENPCECKPLAYDWKAVRASLARKQAENGKEKE